MAKRRRTKAALPVKPTAEAEIVTSPRILSIGQQVVTKRGYKVRNIIVPAGIKSEIEGVYTQEQGKVLYKIMYRRVPVWVDSEDLEVVK